jgi:glucokinase
MNFGGHATGLGRRFLEQIRSEFRNCSLPIIAQELTIQYAMLGSDAGFVGAAGLARTDFRSTAFDSPARVAAPENPCQ